MEHLSSDMEHHRTRTPAGTMEKRQSARALQQRIQSKGDITSAANRTGYSK